MQSQITESPPATRPIATFIEGITDSLPIVIGYLPVAFAFGLSSVKLGFTPLEAIFFSCIIYAGASQFVITALLSAGMSLWVSALTVMAMDIRHILYGPALKHRILTKISGNKTALWAFGLTDEVFAAATAKLMKDQRRWSENWMLGIAFTSWLSWVAGTAIGAMFGNGPLENYPAIEASLSFMLPALFLSFLLASFKRQYSLTVIASLSGALLGAVLFSIPVAILAGISAGCLAALLQPTPAVVTEHSENNEQEPTP
ncbi:MULTISPECIES: AzlC family ABC transporter permease [Yersinia]|uniref:AzlC family ABC transporter permease n=1 Tax=Yersinia TaxID=629 RepID=UPI0005DE32F3|nr:MULTISPECIES: AzlC family ABC transporter permease [Yersinia]ARB86195.1 branched-chain amino acid ABC transporter permease [Yersinia sp. FDAARGOS_228]AVL36046.1 branched-chain amino acid ABC transporter permease [Yersinia intermedia]CND63072.1 putative amino acid transporter [Yersinia intermedia]